MKASDLFLRALENEGVTHIFGVPGEENLDFLDSLRQSSIQLILNRHEQGAAFMAATYGRLTGKPGVCLATLGPGATNFMTPAAYAQLGGMPLVMITGQKPIKKSKQGRFQIVDVPRVMEPVTKMAKQIVHGNTIPALVREAFRVASEEKPGAVLLELPEDIAAEETDAKVFEFKSVRRPAPDRLGLEEAATQIRNAKSPLLLVGAGANRQRTGKALLALIEKTGIPFFNTQMGKGVVPEEHPLFLGTAALSSGDYVHCAIARADLIINVGHDVIEKPPFFMEKNGTRVIHVNYYSAQVDEVYFPQDEVIGDIATAIQSLTDALPTSGHWDFEYFMRVKKEIDLHLKEGSDSQAFPIVPQRLVSAVRQAMPDSGIVCLDNGVYKIWFARNYEARQANTLLLDNALATMGAGLPSAMGAKLVHPDRKVVAICGDGGFMMNSQELETAVRLKQDLVVLILNDSAYGMIKWKQSGLGFEQWGLDYGNPDFVKYAQAYGAHGHRVKSVADLSEQLSKCLDMKGVHVIDVPVDYTENYKVLHDELRARTCLL